MVGEGGIILDLDVLPSKKGADSRKGTKIVISVNIFFLYSNTKKSLAFVLSQKSSFIRIFINNKHTHK